jgi:diacylglycerol O-acyltransferase / wax synthase
MTDTLTALDATFLELEQRDDGALMSIGGVMVFGPVTDGSIPTIAVVRAGIADRLHALPRYSQRLSTTHVGGLSWPHWVPDERFDVEHHVRHAALPAPGSGAQLCEWAADFFSHPLDRTRPLWEMALVEGLEGGRWALAQKTHHCLVDGVGSIGVADQLLDPEREPPPRPAVEPTGPPAGTAGLIASRTPQVLGQASVTGAQVARAGVRAALHPRDAFTRSRELAELIVRDELIAAPHTSLNVPIGQARRFAVVSASLAELKAIGREFGGSFNDVVLGACTSGLRRLLLERDEELPAHGLRAMVPVNLRDASERLALGNRISSLFVDLPLAEPDARARLAMIAASTRRLKRSGAARGAATLLDLAALAPPVLHATFLRTAYATRLFNVTITNVPGAPRQLYAFGSPLEEVHPLVPLAAEHAVGIAILSSNGQVTFGINADHDAMPDVDVLAEGIEDGIDELAAMQDIRSSSAEMRKR